MRKLLIIFILLLFNMSVKAEVEPLLESIDSFFQSDNGYIINIESDKIYTDLTSDKGAYIGKNYSVYRELERLKHPKTGKELESKKEKIGEIEIVEIFNTYSIGKILEKNRDFKKLDLLIPNSSVDVGLYFYNINEEEKSSILKKLQMNENINFVEIPKHRLAITKDTSGAIVASLLVENQKIKTFYYDKNRLKEGSVQQIEIENATISKDVAIPKDVDKTDFSPIIPTAVPIVSENDRAANNNTSKLPIVTKIDKEFKSITLANLFNNSLRYIVVSDEKNVIIYHLTSKGFNKVEELEGNFSNIVNVESIDLNNNGFDELYITDIKNGNINSKIYEFDPNEKKIKLIKENIPYLFRLSVVNGKKLLFAQSLFKEEKGDSGLYLFKYSDGVFDIGEKIENVENFNIFGFSVKDISNPKDLMVFVNNGYKLEIHSNSKKVYESKDKYCNTLHDFTIPKGIFKQLERVNLKCRIFFTKSGDIYLLKNEHLPNVSPKFDDYTESKIVKVAWDGSGLTQLWESGRFYPIIADFFVSENSGKVELFLLRNYESGFFRSKKSELIFFVID